MSDRLVWFPDVEPESYALSDELKQILRRTFRLTGGVQNAVSLTFEHVPYLTGLCDAGIEDAQILLDAIEKHDAVRVWLTMD